LSFLHNDYFRIVWQRNTIADSYADSDCNGDADSLAYADPYSNCHPRSDRAASANSRGYCAASPNSTASTVGRNDDQR
jgi:hypothetical protein